MLASSGCGRSPTDSPEAAAGPEPAVPEIAPLPQLHIQVPQHTGPRGYAGEAALAMVLAADGQVVKAADVFDHSGIDPTLGRGCTPAELQQAGLDMGYSGNLLQVQEDREDALAQIVATLQTQRPVLLEVEVEPNLAFADPRPRAAWVVITGTRGQNLIFHDPGNTDGIDREVAAAELLTPGKHYLPIQKTRSPTLRKSEADHRPFAFSRRIRRLRQEVAPHGLHVTMEEPFVVVGDAPPEQLQRYSTRIVRWAVDLLRKAYFRRDPQALVEIWLLGDDTSYRHWAETRWGDPPDTPYGYYDPAAEVLVMNISTGGGTLVHELVHPFIATNFPRCPKWFDEGLASLYEQSAERDGQIVGLTNWRLAGLQEAIAAGTLPTFHTLCHTANRFYSDDPGTNYAQARYLCYWLQQAGLLHRFYHAFVAAVGEDPSGYKTLQSILGTRNMTGFQARWEREVMQLRYPA